MLIVEKKFDEAARAYAEALKRQPSRCSCCASAPCCEAAGKRQEGEAILARWLREHPKDAVVRLYLAERDMQMKDYKAAAAGYREIVADQSEQRRRDEQSRLDARASSTIRARSATRRRPHRLAPRSPAVADTYGWLLVESGDTKRGTEILGRASKAAPNAHDIRLHYAKALIKSGDKGAARKELEADRPGAGREPREGRGRRAPEAAMQARALDRST